METKNETREDCTVCLALVAFRVYRTMGSQEKECDNEGRIYEGWNDEWDEWIEIHSPRIQPHLSRTNGIEVKDITFDADFDEVHLPDEAG